MTDEDPVPVVLPTVTFTGYQHTTQQPVSAGSGPATLGEANPYPLTSPTDVVFADELAPPQPNRLPVSLQLGGSTTFSNSITFAKPG